MAPRKPRKSKADVKAAADRAERRAKGATVFVSEDASPLDPPETSGRESKPGRFLPGNRFWEARSSAGANPKFANGDDLWKACVEYFEWTDANPLWEDRLVTFQGRATHEPAAKMRAMTLAGLCLFIDITRVTWNEWKKSRPDLSGVIAQAEAVIYAQKFAGAAADLLNANIIARDLGLADKAELTGKDGGPIETADVSDMDTARRVAYMLGQAMKRKQTEPNEA